MKSSENRPNDYIVYKTYNWIGLNCLRDGGVRTQQNQSPTKLPDSIFSKIVEILNLNRRRSREKPTLKVKLNQIKRIK